MKQTKISPKGREILTDAGFLLVSGMLFAIAYNMFLVPGGVVIGGAGGVATVLRLLYGLPTGAMIAAINVPLMALFMHFYGFRASVKGVIGIAVSSIFVDVTDLLGIFSPAFPNPEENMLLCALFGGATIGTAVGLMFARGYTTGGSDLAALLIKMKKQGVSTARLIFLIDATVVIVSAIATGTFVSVFYSFLAILLSSVALGMVTGGFDKTCLAYIFSDQYEQIASEIAEKMKRGVTLLDGMGWYRKEEKKVILCVVKKNEIFPLKQTVRAIDANAFLILGEAEETIGLGFKENIGDVAIEPKKRLKN